jgi:hypothetical protein
MLLAGCGGREGGQGRDEQPATMPPAPSGVATPLSRAFATPLSRTASEAERVKAFLDARYLASDVQYSFHTKFNETIDCIGYLKQPGVKALAAAGTPVTAVPSAAPRPATLPDFAFDGAPDDQGNARACPAGTVPLLRMTADDIAKRGGFDAFMNANTKKGRAHVDPAHGSSRAPDSAGPNYAHVQSDYTGAANLSGGYAVFSVWNPSHVYVAQPNHSIAQTWLLGSGSNGLETVEVGWTVDSSLNGDNDPHLFVFSTNNNYSGGCYNVNPYCPPTFVVESGAWMTPGMTLASGIVGAHHNYISLETYYGSEAGFNGWTISGVGAYHSTSFSGSFQTMAWGFSAGGEVYDQTGTWVFPIGSGSAVNAGDPNTASVSWLENLPVGGSWTTSSFSSPYSTISDYSALASAGPINNYSTAGFYFGNTPKVWWGQNYGYQYSPIGDWASGKYKGECGLGQPIVGVSNDWYNAHALVCNENMLPVNGNSCYARLFAGADNRGYTDNGWDWDVGLLKAECGLHEYVQGVAQDAAGTFQGVLCCPSSQITHSSCQTQTFYWGDSVAEISLPDWDPGFLKGRCPPGYFVEGASQGSPWGGVNSILCCQ